MIVTILLNIVYKIILWILSLLPVFPSLSAETVNNIRTYIDLIINNGLSLFYFFIRPTTFKAALDVLLFIFIAEPIYKFVMWVLRKIPFLGIQ